MIGLSYPLVLAPMVIVFGVLVLLNAYLAVLALLLVACFALAADAVLVWWGVTALVRTFAWRPASVEQPGRARERHV